MSDLDSATVLVLPTSIVHQPRLALLTLASGIPVIVTGACGLPPHEKLHVIAEPDAAALAAAIRSELHPPYQPALPDSSSYRTVLLNLVFHPVIHQKSACHGARLHPHTQRLWHAGR